MENYYFYQIFNYQSFLDTDLVSRTYSLVFSDLGPKEVLVTRGNLVSITYDGILLSLNLNDESPFYFEEHAIYLHTDGFVYLGRAKELYAS